MGSAENLYSMCIRKLSLQRPNCNFHQELQKLWAMAYKASPTSSENKMLQHPHPQMLHHHHLSPSLLCSAAPPESWTSTSTAVPHISSSNNSQKAEETATVSRCAKKPSPWGQDCPWLPIAPQWKKHLHGGVISCFPATGKGGQSRRRISRTKQRCRPSTMSNAWFLRLPSKMLGCQGIWLRIFRVQYSSARSQLSNYINVPIC